MEEKVFNLKVGLFIIISFLYIGQSVIGHSCKALFSVPRLIRQLIKITSSQLKWNVFVKKYNLTMSQIYRRPSQLDILLQKLFEGWHAESVKQHLNFFATREKGVKMTIAESCRRFYC